MLEYQSNVKFNITQEKQKNIYRRLKWQNYPWYC